MIRQVFVITALLMMSIGISFSQPPSDSLSKNEVTALDKKTPTLSQDELPKSDSTAIPNIPDILVYSEDSPQYALIVEKETQQLFLYSYGKEFKQISRLKCSTGKNRGPKLRDGDARTPEGVYFFIKVHEKRELSPIYGIMAFPTDYPNLLDRIAKRTGSAIWLHGTNKILKDRDSNGCIVLEDTDVKTLAKYITLNRTPVIVTDRISYTPVELKIKDQLLKLLSDWSQAVESGTYHDYVRCYDAEYVPDISWWQEWNQLRKTLQASDNPFSCKLKKRLIVRHKNIYVALFDQTAALNGSESFIGTKKLFLSQQSNQKNNPQNNPFRIIGESYQFPVQEQDEETPFIVAARRLEHQYLIAKRSEPPSRIDIPKAVEKSEPVLVSKNTSAPESKAPEKSEPISVSDNTSAPESKAPEKSEPISVSENTPAPEPKKPEKSEPVSVSENTSAPEPKKPEKSEPVSVSENTSAPESSEIEKMVDNWLEAWSSKDIRAYGNFYAKGFRAKGMNKSAWLAYKKTAESKILVYPGFNRKPGNS